MLQFLGDIGGLIEIIFLFCSGLVYLIVDRNFKAAIIRDTYKVQKYSRDQSEFYPSQLSKKSKTVHMITDEEQSSDESSNSDDDSKSRHSQFDKTPSEEFEKIEVK